MRIFFILFLTLKVGQVFSIKGLHVAEVTILGEGEVPSDSEDEVTCTISTIEPAESDVNFMRYVASSEEVEAKSRYWRDNTTAQTFEECADAAAASGAQMFLFDDLRCQLSDAAYEKTDFCSKDQSQMVYMDVDADTSIVPLIRTVPNYPSLTGLLCNVEWREVFSNGRWINVLAETDRDCSGKSFGLTLLDDSYYFVESFDEKKLEDQIAACETIGTQPFAPPDEESIAKFIEYTEGVSHGLALNSTDGGQSYVWSTGVPMPKDNPKWDESETFDKICTYSLDGVVQTSDCQEETYYNCIVPYDAN